MKELGKHIQEGLLFGQHWVDGGEEYYIADYYCNLSDLHSSVVQSKYGSDVKNTDVSWQYTATMVQLAKTLILLGDRVTMFQLTDCFALISLSELSNGFKTQLLEAMDKHHSPRTMKRVIDFYVELSEEVTP